MKDIPKIIYLQLGEDIEDVESFKELEVSWCADKIYDSDIEYIRKEKYEDLEEKNSLCEYTINTQSEIIVMLEKKAEINNNVIGELNNDNMSLKKKCANLLRFLDDCIESGNIHESAIVEAVLLRETYEVKG